jgi:hypothetical protein
MKAGEHEFFKSIVKDLPRECKTIQDYLYMANVYVSVQEKLYFKLKQVPKKECTWLSDEILGQCTDRLDNMLADELEDTDRLKIEEDLITVLEDTKHINIDQILDPYFNTEKRFRFSARPDLITKTSIWELKCTSTITIDHMLQVVLYAWLWRIIHKDDPEAEEKQVKIFNIKTGEILRLCAKTEQLTGIVVALLEGKYGKPETKNDEDFVKGCQDFLFEKPSLRKK